MSRTTTHPLWRPALCAVAVTFGFMLAGSSNAQAALPQAVYNDPADDGKTAPDIRKITITDNGDGTIGVVIDLPPDEALSTEAEVDFMVDVDRNRDTGSKGGAEFAVFHDATGAGVGKWNSSTSSWDNAEHHPLSPTFDAGRLTMTVTLADFGLTTFDFYVVSFRGEDMDAAPEYDDFSWPAAAQRPSIQRVQVPGTLLVP